MEFNSNIGTQLGNEGFKKGLNKQSNKIIVSVFGLTVNPNISTDPVKDKEKHLAVHNAMMKKTQEIFGSENEFKKYVTFRKASEGHKWDDNYINKVDLIPSLEYGRNKWHLQAFIEIRHKSNILLDRQAFIDAYAKALNISPSSVHIDIKTAYKDIRYAQQLRETYTKKGGRSVDDDIESMRNYPLKGRTH